MATAAIPRPLLPLLACVAIPSMGIAASTNVEALQEFGHQLYGGGLAWTLPTAVIGYEIVSSIVFFLSPRSLPGLRKSAAIGALIGFAATVLLAMLWAFIESGALPGGLWLIVIMKPVPSLIAAAFLHMLVMVWQEHAAARDTAASESAAETEADAVIEALGGSVAPPLPLTPASVPAPVPPSPASIPSPLPPAPASAPSPSPRRPRLAAAVPAIVQAQLPDAAKDRAPEKRKPAAKPAQAPAAEPELPRVAREHVDRAAELLLEIVAAEGDTLALESGQALKHFSGASDRTVRAALQVARVELGLPLPKQRRQLATA
ncbi:hypothetical protein [Nonomuraea typhae]|uniref:DUF2637 domain-containing protein n=1 Tax=Nonomuraea typhae TaxID=2603600 RepID=A0ABW7YJ08_9ACTN